MPQQAEPHRRHAGADRDLLGIEEVVEALAVECRARQHQLCPDQHRRIGQAPGVDMKHRHHRTDHVARRKIEAIGQRGAVGMQHGRAMRVERAFRIAGRARGVAKRGSEPLVENRPGEIVGFGGEQLLIAQRVCRRARQRRAIGHRDPVPNRRTQRPQPLDDLATRKIEEHRFIFGVVDDVDDLVVEESRVDGVADRPEP